MKPGKLLPGILLFTLVLAVQAKLNVVATLPDFASIAEAIGGDQVKVTSIARGSEDPHFVDARPSFIRVLNQADVLIEGGADLEVGWLPALLTSARNAKIIGDAPGHVNLALGVVVRDRPAAPVDRSMGDVHPSGNPHFWLDPANGKLMAAQMAKAFSILDGANAATYAANLTRFTETLEKKIDGWRQRTAELKGRKVVTYHKSFDYLLHFCGLELAGTLEPRPGLEPTPTHLKTLVPKMQAEQVKLILIEGFRPRRTPEYVAKQAGARLVILPTSTGGSPEARDYFSLLEQDVSQIVGALKAQP